MNHGLLDLLGTYLTEGRKKLMGEVLQNRTRMITVVLEDIYQSQNASAVVRTCDCFGIQDLHVIENFNKFHLHPKVVNGASKWVNIKQYNEPGGNTEKCLHSLRDQGYYLLATTPDPKATPVYEYSMDQPTAILFGTELTGLSSKAMKLADAQITVPMYGFTESLNLSVSVSLVLSIFREILDNSATPWRLSQEEMDEIRLKWYKQSISNSAVLEREFMKTLKE
jgi:tRNA (guanosine-2'-O-)-methyltransferase